MSAEEMAADLIVVHEADGEVVLEPLMDGWIKVPLAQRGDRIRRDLAHLDDGAYWRLSDRNALIVINIAAQMIMHPLAQEPTR